MEKERETGRRGTVSAREEREVGKNPRKEGVEARASERVSEKQRENLRVNFFTSLEEGSEVGLLGRGGGRGINRSTRTWCGIGRGGGGATGGRRGGGGGGGGGGIGLGRGGRGSGRGRGNAGGGGRGRKRGIGAVHFGANKKNGGSGGTFL